MNKLSYTIEEAVGLTNICRTRLYAEIAAGRLPSVKVGRSTRVLHEDLHSWLHSLPRRVRNHAV
jgi:excisionase family DNA binding protein